MFSSGCRRFFDWAQFRLATNFANSTIHYHEKICYSQEVQEALKTRSCPGVPMTGTMNVFMLRHVIKAITTKTKELSECALECLKEANCKSFQFIYEAQECLLNDRTAAQAEKDLPGIMIRLTEDDVYNMGPVEFVDVWC